MIGWLGKAGVIGTVVTAMVNVGCCGAGFAPLVTALSATGVLSLIPSAWGMPLLYGALALTVVGAALGLRRHRRPYPLLITLAGAGAILLPFHEALDVNVFTGLLWTGFALLALGAAIETWLDLRGGRCSLDHSQRRMMRRIHEAG